MKQRNRIIMIAGIILVLGVIAWYFGHIIAYILIAAVLSIMGHPLVKFFDRLHFKGIRMPHALSSFLALISLVIIIGSLLGLFVPIILSQARAISDINLSVVEESFRQPVESLENTLKSYNLVKPDCDIEQTITARIYGFVKVADFQSILNNLINIAGKLFIGIFAVLFLTFFFLKDEKLFYNSIMLITPDEYCDEMANILSDGKRLLTRYFIGITTDICIVIGLLTLGGTLIGIKNALLVGFVGAVFNVIPYLGPFIGGTLGALIVFTTHFDPANPDKAVALSLTMVGIFALANLLDAILLQPMIYSKSVKAHPIEIFLVIMVAGSLAGVVGMILAIPGYTVIRLFAREFFSRSKAVKKLTSHL